MSYQLDTNIVSELRKRNRNAAVSAWFDAAQPLPVVDGLLAATAIEHDLTLVTREAGALDASGARLLNPWRYESSSG